MCLYPSIIENPRYAKSNENRKAIKDRRLNSIKNSVLISKYHRESKIRQIE
uniref:Uncharacterized protein n=1 Tax=Microviridae sp. ctzsU3 TaxID=2827651 RepID=A0A8S5TA60_9VIRU|nr:MAG TPA: hypothetical protein [Microviridae sp. ctzsU3]